MKGFREFIGFLFLGEGRPSAGYVLFCWAMLVMAFISICALGNALNQCVFR